MRQHPLRLSLIFHCLLQHKGYSSLIKLYEQVYIDFGHKSSAHILSHCLYCECPIVSPKPKSCSFNHLGLPFATLIADKAKDKAHK